MDDEDIIGPSNQVDKSLDLPQNFSFKGGSPPNLCKPSYLNLPFFLAFPNLGTRFLLRVVVCNIPDFWKVQKSQKFETFWIHVTQATKNPKKLKHKVIKHMNPMTLGIKSKHNTKSQTLRSFQEWMALHKGKHFTWSNPFYQNICST